MLTWAVRAGGATHRLDDLPLSVVERVEQEAGVAWDRLRPDADAGHLVALAAALGEHFGFDPASVRRRDILLADDDVPLMFYDGRPDGGRSIDRFVVELFRSGFTPRQVREDFTLRDLHLLSEANR